MGKYMRKSKGIGEIQVMEVAYVGVRTRARALAMDAEPRSGTAKRRKVVGGAGRGELKFSSSLIQLRSRRRLVVTPADMEGSGRRTVSNGRCSSPVSDRVPVSCCSSNASSEFAKESLKIVDLEENSVQLETSTCEFDCRERREMTPSSQLQAESGELESSARLSEANSGRRLTADKMPSETEIEEFFVAAEKSLQKQFTEKYNYDIVKDMPLEGRYEWVRIKP
ncbi:hypothetical protein HYC85_005449 [Camellia sinensis]|uniref:Cyclin-dependent kinase inhibitor domain-containing protein n=1 Tax=Camellia sinensis TaxID=4442 RepID=A0A7J7I1G4_CAMSI|nr:hypothetical protein HYC85_005449 [Camellia sinensis]